MKKFLRIIFILILVYFQAPAQNVLDTTKLVKDFTIDLLGQCYAIQGREIIKLDVNGSIISTYSNKDFGNPSALDARDPLRLIVFYRDFSMIRILDSRLAVQSQLDLRQLGFLDVRLIAGNADQSIWVYDRTYSQLSKIDVRLQKSLLTVDLRQFLGKSIVPKRLELSQNWIVLLNDSDIILLDQYGTCR